MTHHDPWRLRALEESELDALYTGRMERDFPSAERPNLAAMHRHMQNNLQDILIMTDGQQDAAYTVVAAENDLALVTLLAVHSDRRGGGYGSRLLNLLQEHYSAKRAILLEVEKPQDATDGTERKIRERRIAFYERNGYRLLPEIDHSSFGVPLYIMALPLQDTLEGVRASAVSDLRAIYHKILPERLWPMVITN